MSLLLLLGGTASLRASAIPPIVTDVTVCGLSVCMSVCRLSLVHHAKAVGWNEMPFGWDTHVVTGNMVLDRLWSRGGKT